ncbi:hypothetical protein [Salinisphaera hydrothermalis]|uniref:Uncharacterized protein n=1 Tax=Salinisphaera hydrothermalis (strain C41B8) TaxID=1304275 RepID=A0A084IIY9_SALHC|nr:hypothetical protein [Salinisphaera hydrothermalis]KEZ76673.1 hypothetical protein C41B8_13700 [Salinisphaera hydrothermalis C41B8]
MKYVVGYSLPYFHHVQVGIEADSPDHAIERAQALFDTCEIWDDTPEHPLLRDDFDEDVDAGAALTFEIVQTIETEGDFPVSDSSVKQLRSDARARAAARALVAAYQQGETNGGSIDWSDLDTAYELARASQADQP